MTTSRKKAIDQHLRSYFDGHDLTYATWPSGPSRQVFTDFSVACVTPGPRLGLWTYVSNGTSEINGDDAAGMEFILAAPAESPRHVELVTMTAYYHSRHDLGPGHTFPIGESWLPESPCDHMLVSLPYPFGPELEVLNLVGEHIHIHFYWLLPITEAEKEFKLSHGLEALEQLFDDRAINYWDPQRPSAV